MENIRLEKHDPLTYYCLDNDWEVTFEYVEWEDWDGYRHNSWVGVIVDYSTITTEYTTDHYDGEHREKEAFWELVQLGRDLGLNITKE